jgi:hypothetical protein
MSQYSPVLCDLRLSCVATDYSICVFPRGQLHLPVQKHCTRSMRCLPSCLADIAGLLPHAGTCTLYPNDMRTHQLYPVRRFYCYHKLAEAASSILHPGFCATASSMQAPVTSTQKTCACATGCLGSGPQSRSCLASSSLTCQC